MRLTGVLQTKYVPKFLGNRELPITEQVEVEIKHLTHGEREMLKSDISYIQKEGGVEVKVRTRHADLIKLGVLSISGLSTEADGDICTGKELLEAKDHRLGDLIDELVAELKTQSELSDDRKKN